MIGILIYDFNFVSTTYTQHTYKYLRLAFRRTHAYVKNNRFLNRVAFEFNKTKLKMRVLINTLFVLKP